MPGDSYEARLNGTSPVVNKPKGVGAWKATTFLLAVLLVGSVVGLVYFYSNYTTVQESYNKLANQASSNSSKDNKSNNSEGSDAGNIDTPVSSYADFDAEIGELFNLVGSNMLLRLNKLAVTKDGKYVVAIGSVTGITDEDPPRLGAGGAAATYYGAINDGDVVWKKLMIANGITPCSDLDEDAKNFTKNYNYMDDDLGARYIGCQQEDGTWLGE